MDILCLPKPTLVRQTNDSDYELDYLTAPSSEILCDNVPNAAYYIEECEHEDYPSYIQEEEPKPWWGWLFCVYW